MCVSVNYQTFGTTIKRGLDKRKGDRMNESEHGQTVRGGSDN